MSSSLEWRYDTASSQALWLIAHGFVAALGGPLILAVGFLLVLLPTILSQLEIEEIFLAVLLLFVGGPFSVLYLWPMITDPTQRPDITAFVGEDGTLPWTRRSVPAAALIGALTLVALTTVGIPFSVVYGLVILGIFSPVIVSAFTTIGSIEDDTFVCNGTAVPLRQVTGVRSVQLGDAVVCWVSYARGTGILSPRLVTVPAEKAAAVRTALEADDEPPQETSPPSRPVQVVLGGAGLLFFGVAIVAVRAITDPFVSIYVGGVTGVIGLLLCVTGWRGV